MGFIELIGFLILSTVLQHYLLGGTDKIKSDPGDFRPPEPREGEPIPVVFGTVLLSPAMTWFGDVSWKKVKKKESSMAGLIQTDVPLGYEYYAGMQLVLCHGPIDAVLDIYIGEKRVVRTAKYVGEGLAVEPSEGWYAPSTPTLPESYPADGQPTRISINLPDLFGGKEEGGGIVGSFDLHWGSLDQPPNDYLAVWWGVDIVPNYRNIAYAVLRRVNLGKSPSPQPWKFVVKRIPNVIGQGLIFAEIGDGTANPAEVIYEILTNRNWGLGKSESLLDRGSFAVAGQTLYAEGMGYSATLSSKAAAWDAIDDVLNHINGVVYQDPLTGLIALKLVRQDYTVGNLTVLDEENSVVTEYRRGSWGEVINETDVNYVDVERRFSDGVAKAQNLAAIHAMGGEVVSKTINLPGFTTHALAQMAAERANRVTSIPLVRMRIETNRIAYPFHPAYPFVLSYPEYSITGMVCRVVSINYGNLLTGMIEIEAVQDPWDLSGTAYGDPDDIQALEPCGPLALLLPGIDPFDTTTVFSDGYAVMFETPRWFRAGYASGNGGSVHLCQSRRRNDDLYWECYLSIHGATREKMNATFAFCPLGILTEELAQVGEPMKDVSIIVRSAGDLEYLTSTTFAEMLAGSRLLMIGNEIMSWTTIRDRGFGEYQIYGIWRGQLDTVPEHHVQSSHVWFIYSDDTDGAADLFSPSFLDDWTQVNAWPVVLNSDGTSADPDRSEMVGTLISERRDAPYPPGNVRLNGYGYENWPTGTTGDVTLSWTHRSRSHTQMISQDDGAGATIDGTLTVEVLIAGVPVREWTGLTGNSQAYTWAQRQADDADETKRVEFRITPVGTSAEEGTVRTTPSFLMASS